ncbi:MAG: phosphoglycerate kinase [Pseudoruegeria sp.]
MKLRTLNNVVLKGQRILVRADLNVPTQGGKVTDATRIERWAAGMRPLLQAGARLIIVTHMGRPDRTIDPTLSVDKLRPALSKALGTEVRFSDVCAGYSAELLTKQLANGEALLCENLRFNPGEEQNVDAFAQQLARLGDIYVNDAFSCAHRAHASTAAITKYLPSYAGPLFVEEIEALSKALEAPEHPAVAIVGGAKVSSKISVLKNLVQKLDHVIIGGGMANTFLYAEGAPMGRSLHEADQIATVRDIQQLAAQSGCQIHLPRDVVVAEEFTTNAKHHVVAANNCPIDGLILDAGPDALADFKTVLAECHTILWNGPLGAFEMKPFDRATVGLAQAAAQLTTRLGVTTIAGGGDTVAALNEAHVSEQFSYVSTAGGAFLEWLEGKTLPGVTALQDAAKAA